MSVPPRRSAGTIRGMKIRFRPEPFHERRATSDELRYFLIRPVQLKRPGGRRSPNTSGIFKKGGNARNKRLGFERTPPLLAVPARNPFMGKTRLPVPGPFKALP